MKNSLTTVLFIFTLLFVRFSYSQTFEFQKGFYVDNKGDSAFGYVYDDGLKSISMKFSFKSDLKSETKVISANQVKEVIFGQSNHLITHFDSVDNQHYFLSELEHGAINLFAYYHNEEYTFIVEKNGNQATLYQYAINNVSGERVKSSKYIGLLKIFTEDCSKIANKTEKLTFELYAIREFVSDYNQCIDPKKIKVVRKIPIKYGIGLGFNHNQSEIYFTTIFKDVEQESNFGLVLGGFIELKLSKRLSTAVFINYTEYNSSLTNFLDPTGLIPLTVDFRFTYLDLPLQLQYKVIDSKEFNFSVYGGYGIGFLLTKEIAIESDLSYVPNEIPFELDKPKFGGKVGIGLSFRKFSTQIGYYKSRGTDGPSNVITYQGIEYVLSYAF